MEMLLHMCDVSNPLKSTDISINWGLRCVAEFLIQGDKEQKLGLPILRDLYDRDMLRFHQSQIGFIEYVVMPL